MLFGSGHSQGQWARCEDFLVYHLLEIVVSVVRLVTCLYSHKQLTNMHTTCRSECACSCRTYVQTYEALFTTAQAVVYI